MSSKHYSNIRVPVVMTCCKCRARRDALSARETHEMKDMCICTYVTGMNFHVYVCICNVYM